MITYSKIPVKHVIPIMTNHIYQQIPIRLANRVTDLNNLPFGLSKNHSINKIREWYLLSFEEIISIEEPKINITLNDFDNYWIYIKISDNGHGIPEENLEKIWYYSYTTHLMNTLDIIEHDDFSIKSPLSGFGYGLPISDVYLNFLNSSHNNIKIISNNEGTNIYLLLRKYSI